MAWQLSYQVQMQRTDQSFHPDGVSYPFYGVQNFAGDVPQNADIAALVALMASDVQTKIQLGFPADQVENLQGG